MVKNKLDKDTEEEIEVVKANEKRVNSNMFTILGNYYNASSCKERAFDFLLPFIIILLINIFFAEIVDDWSSMKFTKSIFSSNDLIVNVMAILSGFNTASLSIIGTSNMKNISNQTTSKIVDYFSFAIMLQLVILLIGISVKFSADYLIELGKVIAQYVSVCSVKYTLLILSTIWYTAVISSVLVSIRSLPIISNVVKLMINNQK